MAKTKINYVWRDRKRILGIPMSFTRYAISEDRLFLQTGCLSIRDEEVLLYRVRDISMRRSFAQRLVGVGTITVTSSDRSTPNLIMRNVKNPQYVKELLHKNVEKMKMRRRVRVGEIISSPKKGDDYDEHDIDDDLDTDED